MSFIALRRLGFAAALLGSVLAGGAMAAPADSAAPSGQTAPRSADRGTGQTWLEQSGATGGGGQHG
jgi:Spy/CpxP family protein refolding chaperone